MTSSYSRFNLIIYPLLEKLGGELNVLRYQFNTLIETQQFIKEYIKTNGILSIHCSYRIYIPRPCSFIHDSRIHGWR